MGEPVGDSIKQVNSISLHNISLYTNFATCIHLCQVASHLASDDASQSSEETEVAEETETDDDTAESI